MLEHSYRVKISGWTSSIVTNPPNHPIRASSIFVSFTRLPDQHHARWAAMREYLVWTRRLPSLSIEPFSMYYL